MIVVGIASIPEREGNLFQIVQSIYPYVDNIFIALNGYKTYPQGHKWDIYRPKCVFWVKGEDNRGDAEKFYGFELSKEQNEPFYYLTLDDDLVVDGDSYVFMMIEGVKKYGCPVSLHGKTYGDHTNSWRRPVLNYRCLDIVSNDAPVDVVGTGCLAVHSDMMNITMDMFPKKNMADLWFSYEAKKAGIPLMVLAHPEGLVRTTLHSNAPTLWKDKTDEVFKTELVNKILSFKG